MAVSIDNNISQAKFSKAVVIAISKPPSWKSPFKDSNAIVNSLTFENIFVYNYYVVDERTKYNFATANQRLNFRSTGIESQIRDQSLKITGQRDGDSHNFNRLASENMPSYIRLSWEPPEGFNDPDLIANESRINAFKFLAGQSSAPEAGNYNFSSIRSFANFEQQQNHYIKVTNEYLDMFSFDPDGNSINQWFAEELDSTFFDERLGFIYNRVVSDVQYRNFSNNGTNWNTQTLDTGHTDFNNTSGDIDPKNSVVQVYDSALLEDLNFPTHDLALPEDTTIVLNTEYAWSIALASAKNSGLLLGMQTRVRNMKYWQQVLIKSEVQWKERDVSIDRVVKSTGRSHGPLEHILDNSFPYQIEDLNRHSGQSDLEFKLVGFVIEKTQRVETENREDDEIPFIYEKFPLIFVPCSPGKVITSCLDSAINYDKEYDYVIRAVFSFHLDIPISGGGVARHHYFLNSPQSTLLTIETREVVPPPYPRDIWAFHEFYTGDEGALALHWAFPVNKQRDTTYFAIFRRKSIYEPFQLLKIFDFNYSISDPEQSAREIKAKIFGHAPMANAQRPQKTGRKIKRLSGYESKTMFKDRTFRPNVDYIYTVCAIDAHGQMSNYGAQIKVRLDDKSYNLDVRQISPPGAPLTLPNYFIKSKAIEDVARTANYRKAILRFRPDYKSIDLANAENILKEKKIVHGIDTNDNGNSANCYYLQIINPDRANDIILKYQIDDIFDLNNDEETLKNLSKYTGLPYDNF